MARRLLLVLSTVPRPFTHRTGFQTRRLARKLHVIELPGLFSDLLYLSIWYTHIPITLCMWRCFQDFNYSSFNSNQREFRILKYSQGKYKLVCMKLRIISLYLEILT